MTTPDPFEFDDAAYVLGALAPDEHAAFEAHLATCAACRDRVRELRAQFKTLAETDTLTGYGAYALLSDNGKNQGFVIGVPEPATWAMMIIGFGAVGMMVRSRRRLALAA